MRNVDGRGVCPSCGGPISGIDTRGRGRHEAEPCGCAVSDAHWSDGPRVATDGGVSYHDLTAFQRDILWSIVELEDDKTAVETYGLAIKRKTEETYREEITHARLYQNLDELVELGLVEKSALDLRTNEYSPTPAARMLLREVAQERAVLVESADAVATDGGRR